MSKVTTNPLLEAALEWAEFCRVVPCQGKNPGGHLGRRWNEQASRDPDHLHAWWARWPQANVGIVPGRDLLPVDVDRPDEFERLQTDTEPAPPTPRCYTNGEPGVLRERLIFRHPGVALTDELAPGVQLRDGERVQTLLPSINPKTGEPYEWRDAPDEVPICALPASWLERARRPAPQSPRTPGSEWWRLSQGVEDGSISGGEGRKKAACRIAGHLLAKDVDVYLALGLLLAWDQRNRPPLGEAEIETSGQLDRSRGDAEMNDDGLKAMAVAQASRNGPGSDKFAVTFTDHKVPKLILPDVPEHDDLAGLAAWLTSVFRLDSSHPIKRAMHQGLRGQDGHAELQRVEAPPLRFEPAAALNTARRLLPALSWQLIPTDGEPYGFKDEHCRRIAYVVRLLCVGASEITEQEETTGIVGYFLGRAHQVEGCTTYGDTAQRYEAAVALQRSPMDPWIFLVDADTGELVIRLSDLREAAREYSGSGIPRGYPDARMEQLGWKRIELDGHARGGRTGRDSPHARCYAYRGLLPAGDDADSVTT